MKGAVKRNTSPPTGRRGYRHSWQPARVSVETIVVPAFVSIRAIHQYNVVVLRKLKSGMGIVADHSSI